MKRFILCVISVVHCLSAFAIVKVQPKQNTERKEYTVLIDNETNLVTTVFTCNEKELTAVIDSSFFHTAILGPGIAKLWGSADDCIKEIGSTSEERILADTNGTFVFKPGFTIGYGDKKLSDGFYFDFDEKRKLDAVLSLSAFMKMSNVTIDYKNSSLILNESPLPSPDIPMEIIVDDGLYIPVSVNGKDVLVMIDTGFSSDKGNCMLVSSNLYVNKTVKLKFGSTKFDKYPEGIIDTLKIGNVEYTDVLTRNCKDPLNVYENVSKIESVYKKLEEKNVIGADFFKDHIIQFDFENMVFRIM